MCRVSVRLLSTLEFMWVVGMNLTSLVNQEIVTSFRGLYHAIFPPLWLRSPQKWNELIEVNE